MKCCVIIPAAGASRRYNEASAGLAIDRSKLDEELGGRPVLHRTVEMFSKRAEVGSIIVAAPADDDARAEFMQRHGDKLGILGARIVTGGMTHRYESVRNAVLEVPADATHIAVHDAARPCTPELLLDRLFEAAEHFEGVIPAVRISDTVKRVGEEPVDHGEADPLAGILGDAVAAGPTYRAVESTVPRDGLWSVQTPQVFEADVLRRAYAQDDLDSTDDAGLVEKLGVRVIVIEGDPRNVKITTPVDLEIARAVGGFGKPVQRSTHKRF